MIKKVRKPWGFWNSFFEAVEAMELHDLLIWRIEKADVRNIQIRLDDYTGEDVKLATKHCDGKLFVIRMR